MIGSSTIFLAGASGAVGRPLCRLLLEEGHRVVGTTRSAAKAAELAHVGVEPAVVDVFEREALIDAVVAARPQVVIHQLTDLPQVFSPEAMAEARPRNARLREVGTENLVAAATAAGASRLIAQSIAFAYAEGPRPFTEESPLSPGAAAVSRLEELVLGAPMQGIVLRYGRFYGPATWVEQPPQDAPVHVEAAADAARRAVSRGSPGIYNVAEEDGMVSSARARQELGWRPEFRLVGDERQR